MAASTALSRAEEIWRDVDSLIEHHPAAKGEPKQGRPEGSYGHLLRSSVSLCYTGWEVFVEESLLETVDRLIEANDVDALPTELRTAVADATDDPWDLVGDGWKDITRAVVRKRVKGDGKRDFGLNTANVPTVKSLYTELVGYSPLHEISWQRKGNEAVRAHIQRLVSTRGEIVHAGTTPDNLSLARVRSDLEFVRRLATQFDIAMRAKF